MTRKLLGVSTSITAALLAVSVAWAAGDDGSPVETETALDLSAGLAASSTSATGVTLPSSTSTTVTTASSSTSVTSAGSSTSVTTAGGDSTSTTVERKTAAEGGGTFHIPGVGSVTVETSLGALVITDISAPGWEVRIKDARHDRVRLEFRRGDAEARFEIRLRSDGRLEIEIRRT